MSVATFTLQSFGYKRWAQRLKMKQEISNIIPSIPLAGDAQLTTVFFNYFLLQAVATLQKSV